MRLPSENFFRRFLTFHSTSAGGFLEPPPKYMSYSIFSRRSWSSSRLSSSSIATARLHFRRQRSGSLQGSVQAEYTIRRSGVPTYSRYSPAPALRYLPETGPPPFLEGPEYRSPAI